MELIPILALLFLWIFSSVPFVSPKAPGTLYLTFSMSADDIDVNTLQLNLVVIGDNGDTLASLKKMKRNSYSMLEARLEIERENIAEQITYRGFLMYGNKSIALSDTIHFNKYHSNTGRDNPSVAKVVFLLELERYLEVTITAKCRKDYYPKHVCTKFCQTSKDMTACTEEGEKLCNTGFYLKDSSCLKDWCNSTTRNCENGGKCINRKTKMHCECNSLYTGEFCEERIDLCKTYECLNGTTCLMLNDKVSCENLSRSDGTNSEEFSTIVLISIGTIGLIIIICTSIALWACRRRRDKSFSSLSYDSNSNLQKTYYHNAMEVPQSYYRTVCTANIPPHYYCPENLNCSMNNFLSLRPDKTNAKPMLYRVHSDVLRKPELSPSIISLNFHDSIIPNDQNYVENIPLPPPIESEDFNEDVLIL